MHLALPRSTPGSPETNRCSNPRLLGDPQETTHLPNRSTSRCCGRCKHATYLVNLFNDAFKMSASNRSRSNHLRSPDRMRENVPVHTEVFQGVFLKLDVKTANCEATGLQEPELHMWVDPTARPCFQMFPHTRAQFNPFITSRHQKASA